MNRVEQMFLYYDWASCGLPKSGIACRLIPNFSEFFIYFGDQSFIWCGVGEDLSSFSRLSFCLIDCVLCFTETSISEGPISLLLLSMSVLLVLYLGSDFLCPCFQYYFPFSLQWGSVSGDVSLISFSAPLSFVYRKATDFFSWSCILLHY